MEINYVNPTEQARHHQNYWQELLLTISNSEVKFAMITLNAAFVNLINELEIAEMEKPTNDPTDRYHK